MWSLETIIAQNRRRQAEYDKAHPEEAERRIAEDEPVTVPRAPGRTGIGRDAPCEDAPTVQSKLAGPLVHTLSLYLQ
jgi:hypothetical protein